MATIFDLSENTAPDGTDRIYITDGTNDEGVQIANLLKGSGAEVPAAKITGTVAHERGGLEADVSAYDGIVQISGGSTSAIKNNWSASAAPTTGDDSGDGYVVGSRWIDTTNDKEYVCLDNTAAAAVWTETTGGGGGGGGVISMQLFPSGSSMGGQFYCLEFSSTDIRVMSQIASGTSPHLGGVCVLPAGLTSIDSAKVYVSSSSLTENTMTVLMQAVADGEDERTGGSFGSYSAGSSWYTKTTVEQMQLLDISSAIPSAVSGEDWLKVVIDIPSPSVNTRFGPVIITYS